MRFSEERPQYQGEEGVAIAPDFIGFSAAWMSKKITNGTENEWKLRLSAVFVLQI